MHKISRATIRNQNPSSPKIRSNIDRRRKTSQTTLRIQLEWSINFQPLLWRSILWLSLQKFPYSSSRSQTIYPRFRKEQKSTKDSSYAFPSYAFPCNHTENEDSPGCCPSPILIRRSSGDWQHRPSNSTPFRGRTCPLRSGSIDRSNEFYGVRGTNNPSIIFHCH